jgi:hypothetical protein
MRLTRARVRAARARVRAYLTARWSALRRAARAACRGVARVTPRTDLAVQFAHAGEHWAETDGATVWLNAHLEWTPSALFWTLLHEALHYAVRRASGHELSERAEHRMMERLSRRLV